MVNPFLKHITILSWDFGWIQILIFKIFLEAYILHYK